MKGRAGSGFKSRTRESAGWEPWGVVQKSASRPLAGSEDQVRKDGKGLAKAQTLKEPWKRWPWQWVHISYEFTGREGKKQNFS